MLRKVIDFKMKGLKLTYGARARSVVMMEIIRTRLGRLVEGRPSRCHRGRGGVLDVVTVKAGG